MPQQETHNQTRRRILPLPSLTLLCAAAAALLPGRGAPPAAALTLGEGLAIVEGSGRDAALSLAREQVLASAPVLAGAPRRPSIDAYARETLLVLQPGVVAGMQTLDTAEQDSFSYGVRARQLLSDFGRTDAAVRAAGADLEAQRLETALARNRAALRFILSYLRLLRAERQLALQTEEVKRFEAHRANARALLEAGTATENEVLQAEVHLADAVQRRLQAANVRALAAAQVNSLLLRPLDEPLAPEEVSPPAASAPGLADALAAAEQGRVELQAIGAQSRATEARRDALRSDYYPQLYVAGGYDFSQNRYQVHEGNWSLLAGMEVNLFSGRITGEKIRQKESELRALARAREQLLDAVRLEVQEALLSLETARARVGAAGTAVDQAQENLRLAQLSYAEGVGTSTDVLDAVSLLSTAEQNALNARHDVVDAQARLDFALGRDLVAAWGQARTTGGKGRP
ncbi:MAG TPA: TolC family protein [Candidatus Methanoperedens sp.]|nr:TolC family protein [Candidatus Methanoperedens sp.]